MIYSHFFPSKRIFCEQYKLLQKKFRQKQNIPNYLFFLQLQHFHDLLTSCLMYTYYLWSLWTYANEDLINSHQAVRKPLYLPQLFLQAERYLHQYGLYSSFWISNNMYSSLGCKFAYPLYKSCYQIHSTNINVFEMKVNNPVLLTFLEDVLHIFYVGGVIKHMFVPGSLSLL